MEVIGGVLMLVFSFLYLFNPANRITDDREDWEKSKEFLKEKGLWGNKPKE